MALVKRDPFARLELHRSPVPALGRTCDWCGNTASGNRLFKYRIEHDGGREEPIRGTFCSTSCCRSFHE